MTRNASAAILVFFLLAGTSGCGNAGKPDLATTVPVKGRVTYHGRSLGNGSIRFEPDAGREASASIQQDGTFTLSTYTSGDGAVLGTHRIAVTGRIKDGESVPPKFGSFNSSQVEIEVTRDKSDYAIDLK